MKRKMTPKSLTVASTQQLSENFQRIVFKGEDLKQFPSDCAGYYMKLLFNPDGGTDISNLAEGQRPSMRTYTIRDFDENTQNLTVDFVRHQSASGNSLAANWAEHAKPGDSIMIGGPAPIQGINTDVDTVVFVADMTSLPAIAVKLEQLPENTKGHAFIQVTHESDIQTLTKPADMDITWLVGESSTPMLSEEIEKLTTPHGTAAIWCACEFSQMRAIRRHVSDNWNTNRDTAYFSSYWKIGVTEDGHKAIKQEDAKAFNS